MEDRVVIIVELLCLLAVANGTPVLVTRIFGSRGAWPLDGGIVLGDGRRLLGASKTVRGFVSAVAATAMVAPVLGISAGVGALIGATAMAGDLFSSFIKRRLGIPSSGRASGLDQVPESLFPLLACYRTLDLDLLTVALVVLLFGAGQALVSPLMYRLGVRRHPH